MNPIRSIALCALVFGVAVAQAQPSVNIIVGGEVSPGVYGRVEIGNAPPPPVFYRRPVIIVPPPPARVVVQEPIYLHVPPGHAKRWGKHCRAYNACGRPVYFVRSAEYEPDYRKYPHGNKKHGKKDRDHDD